MFFIVLLSLASQRAEYLVLEWSGISWLQELVEFWKARERGSLPGLIESTVILFIASKFGFWHVSYYIYIKIILNYCFFPQTF